MALSRVRIKTVFIFIQHTITFTVTVTVSELGGHSQISSELLMPLTTVVPLWQLSLCYGGLKTVISEVGTVMGLLWLRNWPIANYSNLWCQKGQCNIQAMECGSSRVVPTYIWACTGTTRWKPTTKYTFTLHKLKKFIQRAFTDKHHHQITNSTFSLTVKHIITVILPNIYGRWCHHRNSITRQMLTGNGNQSPVNSGSENRA